MHSDDPHPVAPSSADRQAGLIDTHCHLAHRRLLHQVPAVLKRAEEAGVRAVISASGDLQEARRCLQLAAVHSCVYFTAGVHPHEAKDAGEGYLDELRSLADEPKCVAVGECGLDYHYDFSPRAVQRRIFAEQLEAAGQAGKVVVVHTREAFADTLAILKDSRLDGRRVVFHSFTEQQPADLRAALDHGATISFSGIVTFAKTADLRQAAAIVPAERLLIETDAPYLSPEPVRGSKTNEPANVRFVAACLAKVRGVSPAALAEQTSRNARELFGLAV